ncbi:hypothetical protein HAX54_019729 [Datura stramonium]|uniref:Uncharacterized protein n=1 Tax=Datura stramonium TaxID=4076 RepID=A0ABS8USM2_DATST|nr:hypothetical protein [Datura stramonium]
MSRGGRNRWEPSSEEGSGLRGEAPYGVWRSAQSIVTNAAVAVSGQLRRAVSEDVHQVVRLSATARCALLHRVPTTTHTRRPRGRSPVDRSRQCCPFSTPHFVMLAGGHNSTPPSSIYEPDLPQGQSTGFATPRAHRENAPGSGQFG